MRQFMLAALLAAACYVVPLSPEAALAQPAQNPGGSLAPPPKFLTRDLQAMCDGAEGSARLAGCLRYMQAAVAMYELIIADGKEITWFCAPRDAQPALLRQQFVEWMRDNSDQMGVEAIQGVRLALADAFPCQGD